MLSAKVADKIKESMSKGRKIFRFLKFLGEIKRIQKISKTQKHWSLKFLLMIIHTAGFFFYILDNMLWGINIGVLR